MNIIFDTFFGNECTFHITSQLKKPTTGCKVIMKKKLSGQTTNDKCILGNYILGSNIISFKAQRRP